MRCHPLEIGSKVSCACDYIGYPYTLNQITALSGVEIDRHVVHTQLETTSKIITGNSKKADIKVCSNYFAHFVKLHKFYQIIIFDYNK